MRAYAFTRSPTPNLFSEQDKKVNPTPSPPLHHGSPESATPDPADLVAEITAIDETVHAVLVQNRELWQARNAIVSELIQTYPYATLDDVGDPNPRPVPYVVTNYSRDAAHQRSDIFHQLDRINKLLAPAKERLRELRAERAAATRQLNLANKPKPKQGELFI